MKNQPIFVLIVILAALAAGCGSSPLTGPTAASTYDAALREPPNQLYPVPAPRTEGSLFSDNVDANLFTDLKAARVGDIITINISETSEASGEASTTLGRQNDVSAGISTLLGFEQRLLPQGDDIEASSMIGASWDSDFKGSGETTRNESMTAQISARVLQVLPNGNLVIRGSREIVVNFERKLMVIQGVVRPADISPSNTVQSTHIADAVIEYTGEGDVTSQQRAGWLSRILNYVWPF